MGIALPGLGGFNTQGIVEKLMSLEKVPLIKLQRRQAEYKSQVQVFQNMNTKFANIKRAAWDVYGRVGKESVRFNTSEIWEAAKATSSDPMVGVTTSPGAQVGSVEFDVLQVAKSKQATLDQDAIQSLYDAAKAKGGEPPKISIMLGDKITTISPTSADASAFARAINAASGSGVNATAVRVGDNPDGTGKYLLQINGAETGANKGDYKIFAGDITQGLGLTAKSSKTDAATNSAQYVYEDAAALAHAVAGTGAQEQALNIIHQSSDAKIRLLGQERTYGSNQIQIMDNVKIDLSNVVQKTNADGTPVYTDALLKGVKINATRDFDVAAGKMEKMMGALTDALTTLNKGMQSVTKEGIDPLTNKRFTYTAAGPLGNSEGRDLKNKIMGLVSSGITLTDAEGKSQTYSLASFGISLGGGVEKGANGKFHSSQVELKFDAEKFKKAMESDPEKVQQVMVEFAKKVGDMASKVSDFTEGTLTKTIESKQSTVSYYNNRVSEYDDRLARKEAQLYKQYSSLETMLARMQQQQAWLAGQLAQLGGQ
ncbi:flagellar filament capping protein FliD [uncultured Mobiluncus sp.]|uniref:flagellar filament capping protein FliD n=1 Tax=uncultured Mobiluncus sp. TaxID=293425 RepID=UPI00262A7F52|nr:flagellar filament capping protein FliD [uncultured Mobiluncus sp.]